LAATEDGDDRNLFPDEGLQKLHKMSVTRLNLTEQSLSGAL
jgi:hypothetical protein